MKRYLGDGVYIDSVRGIFILTTEDGINITNRITLDYSIINAMNSYVTKIFKEL